MAAKVSAFFNRLTRRFSSSQWIYIDEKAILLPSAARPDWISKRKAVTQRNDGLLERLSMDQRNLYRVVSIELLNNYVRQGCEREAGKQKHNCAKHRVSVFDKHADPPFVLAPLGGCEEFSHRRSPRGKAGFVAVNCLPSVENHDQTSLLRTETCFLKSRF